MFTALLFHLSVAATPGPIITPRVTGTPQDDPPIQLWISNDGRFVPGDRVQVYVRSQDDGHLLVLHVDPDGQMRILFPLDPRDDNVVQGGKRYEVRDRGDREAFEANLTGRGTVYAAVSRDPFRFDQFIVNDHWDYGTLAPQRLSRDPEAQLTDLVRGLAQGDFDYDVLTYDVTERTYNSNSYSSGSGYSTSVYASPIYSTGYGSPFCGSYYYGGYCQPYYSYPHYGYGYGYGGYGSYLSIGFSFGYPYYPFYRPFYYDPFFYHPGYISPYSTRFSAYQRYPIYPGDYLLVPQALPRGTFPVYRNRAFQQVNGGYTSPSMLARGSAAMPSRRQIAQPAAGAVDWPVRATPVRAEPRRRVEQPPVRVVQPTMESRRVEARRARPAMPSRVEPSQTGPSRGRPMPEARRVERPRGESPSGGNGAVERRGQARAVSPQIERGSAPEARSIGRGGPAPRQTNDGGSVSRSGGGGSRPAPSGYRGGGGGRRR